MESTASKVAKSFVGKGSCTFNRNLTVQYAQKCIVVMEPWEKVH